MGWLFTQGASRRDIINNLVQPEENENRRWETITHCLRGNVLWSIIKLTKKSGEIIETFIGCHLLSNDKGYGWGYKDMCESMGPCYYTCPIKYLEMVPVANQAWRDEVMAYHKRMSRHFAVGQKVALESASIPWAVLTSIKPLLGVYGGMRYRIPRRMIGDML
ncbi:MAG: hypothetical protein RPU52_09860 [Candidatus Sedimenticola sp. (ex Thyasira tokunagai)]